MVALPDPLSQVMERGGVSPSSPARQVTNLHQYLSVRRQDEITVNPKAEMHHALRRDDRALCRGDVTPQTHCSVQKCVYKLTSPRHMNKTPGNTPRPQSGPRTQTTPTARTKDTTRAQSKDKGHKPRPKPKPGHKPSPQVRNQDAEPRRQNTDPDTKPRPTPNRALRRRTLRGEKQAQISETPRSRVSARAARLPENLEGSTALRNRSRNLSKDEHPAPPSQRLECRHSKQDGSR